LRPNKPRGVPRVDDGPVLNGVFWVFDQTTFVARFHQLMNEPGRREEDAREAALAPHPRKRSMTLILPSRNGSTMTSSSSLDQQGRLWRRQGL
jgi:hypothetical protein